MKYRSDPKEGDLSLHPVEYIGTMFRYTLNMELYRNPSSDITC